MYLVQENLGAFIEAAVPKHTFVATGSIEQLPVLKVGSGKTATSIPLPIDSKVGETLASLCSASPFGRGADTVFDEKVEDQTRP